MDCVGRGMIRINCYKRVNPGSPFGGVRGCGYGRDMGFEAIIEYTSYKSVWVNVDANISPYYPRRSMLRVARTQRRIASAAVMRPLASRTAGRNSRFTSAALPREACSLTLMAAIAWPLPLRMGAVTERTPISSCWSMNVHPCLATSVRMARSLCELVTEGDFMDLVFGIRTGCLVRSIVKVFREVANGWRSE